jgi:hypothetical protein
MLTLVLPKENVELFTYNMIEEEYVGAMRKYAQEKPAPAPITAAIMTIQICLHNAFAI